METEANPVRTAFEGALLDALLAGDHPYLAALRTQLQTATAVSRQWNPAGEYLNFVVSLEAAPVSPANFEIGDVYFDLQNLPHGGGAVLFVKNGTIAFLETYSYEGDFPAPGFEIGLEITYHHGTRDIGRLQQELDWRLRSMPLDQVPPHFGTSTKDEP